MASAKTFLVTGTLFVPNGGSIGHAIDYIFARWHTAKIKQVERKQGGKKLLFAIEVTQFNNASAESIVIDTLRMMYTIRDYNVIDITR